MIKGDIKVRYSKVDNLVKRSFWGWNYTAAKKMEEQGLS